MRGISGTSTTHSEEKAGAATEATWMRRAGEKIMLIQ
jgi:hypothetical protein